MVRSSEGSIPSPVSMDRFINYLSTVTKELATVEGLADVLHLSAIKGDQDFIKTILLSFLEAGKGPIMVLDQLLALLPMNREEKVTKL